MADDQFTQLLQGIQGLQSKIDHIEAEVGDTKKNMAAKADIEHLDGKLDHIADNMATRDDQA